MAEEFGFHFDLQCTLSESMSGKSLGGEMSLHRRIDGAPHAIEFHGVLAASELGQCPAEAIGGVLVDHGLERRPRGNAVLRGALLDVARSQQRQPLSSASLEPAAQL